MKSITVSRLQDQASSVAREVENGEVYKVLRYSKTVGYLIPKEDYDNFLNGNQCKKCIEDLRKIAKKIRK